MCGVPGLFGHAGGAPIARPFENRFTRATGLNYAGGYPGAYPFVGSPDDVADEMVRMSKEGLAVEDLDLIDPAVNVDTTGRPIYLGDHSFNPPVFPARSRAWVRLLRRR